jgi:Flp pilus assembly pilin Flp
MSYFIKLLQEDEAATAVEYAVMVGLIIMACFVGIISVGTQTNTTLEDINTKATSAGLGK